MNINMDKKVSELTHEEIIYLADLQKNKFVNFYEYPKFIASLNIIVYSQEEELSLTPKIKGKQ